MNKILAERRQLFVQGLIQRGNDFVVSLHFCETSGIFQNCGIEQLRIDPSIDAVLQASLPEKALFFWAAALAILP